MDNDDRKPTEIYDLEGGGGESWFTCSPGGIEISGKVISASRAAGGVTLVVDPPAGGGVYARLPTSP